MNTDTLNLLWRNFIPVLKQTCIVADAEFYNAAADKFRMTVVDDETDKCERPYETVLEEWFTERYIHANRDLVGFFLHVASHQRCDVFWQSCPVLMEQFTPHQLDFIEEVYNQRLVSIVAPSFYDTFPEMNARYDKYKGFDVAKRQPLQTMFGQACDTGIAELNTLHAWLYGCDPLSQQTFNTYMHMWTVLLGVPKIKRAIVDYES